MQQPSLSPVGIYVHVPFCSKKCPYCHFFVLPDQQRWKLQFLEAIKREWAQKRPLLEGKQIVSLYLGGGTPSRLSVEQLGEILQLVWGDSSVHVAPDCEVTLEVNPEDASPLAIRGWKGLGVNRVSMGVQSLDPEQLQLLGRQHDAMTPVRALTHLAESGIANLSIDLMYDLPQQTQKSWHTTLQRLGELPITHLSLYNLTLEPHTLFFKKKAQLLPQIPSPEVSLILLQEALTHLEGLGLHRYEISAFAKPGYESHHNSGYWTGRPFLGFGPSAFSYWEGRRFQNICHLNRYATLLEQGASAVDFEEKLSLEGQIAERLAIHLRLMRGVNMDQFCQEVGKFSERLQQSVGELVRDGLLLQEGSHLRLSERGTLLYDIVGATLVEEPQSSLANLPDF